MVCEGKRKTWSVIAERKTGFTITYTTRNKDFYGMKIKNEMDRLKIKIRYIIHFETEDSHHQSLEDPN